MLTKISDHDGEMTSKGLCMANKVVDCIMYYKISKVFKI